MKHFIFLIIISCGLHVQSQQLDIDKLDSLLTWIGGNNEGMGTLSIFQNGIEVYQNNISASSELHKPTATNLYRIGSITKTFTASMILLLVEENKLSLDSKLSIYFPEVSNAKDISIQMLLNHTSGIYNFTDDPRYKQWMIEPIDSKTLLKQITQYEPAFGPGAKYGYSNSNYALLSMIAEQIEKESMGEILEKNIITPLQLEDTYYGDELLQEQTPKSYFYNDNWINATNINMSVPMGAGAITSSASNVNAFFVALFNEQIVNQTSLTQMMDVSKHYGLGLMKVSFYNRTAYGHNGGIDGFQSMAFYFPGEQMSITYLSNGVKYPVNDILIGALSICFNQPYNFPSFKPEYKPKKSDIKSYLGLYGSPTFPIDITIEKVGNTISAQATNQSSFELFPVEAHIFRFDPAGIIMEFRPKNNLLIITQNGKKNSLYKKN